MSSPAARLAKFDFLDFSSRPLGTLLLGTATGVSGALIVAIAGKLVSPIIGAAAVVGLLVTLAMVWWPNFAVYVLAFSIPFERMGRFTDDFDTVAVSMSRILGVIALGAFFLHATVKRWKIHTGTAFWLYAGYTLIALCSNLWAFSPEETFRDGFRILGNLVFFFLLINIIRDFKTAKITFIIWMLANVATCVYSLYDYYAPSAVRVEEADMGLTSNRMSSVVIDDSETRSLGAKVKRAFGPTAHPTLFGLNLTMAIPFFFWQIRTRKWPWTWFWFAYLLLAAFNVALSNTRAVMLLFIGTVGYCVLRGLFRLSAKSIAVLIILGITLLPLIPEDVYMRTLDPSLYTTEKGDSIRVRFKFWEKSWILIQENWLTGIGVGDQTTIVKMVTDEVTGRISPAGLAASAHNEYIWVMVEVGILGYLLFWGFIAWVTWAVYKAGFILKKLPDYAEEYWFLVACSIPMTGILFFALQTEVFHFALKGWWMMAAVSVTMLRFARNARAEQLEQLHAEQERPSPASSPGEPVTAGT